jgi:hypothetical protein
VKTRFSAPVQTGLGPTQSPIKYFLGVKLPGDESSHPLPNNAEVKERVQRYLYFYVACSRAKFTFIYIYI